MDTTASTSSPGRPTSALGMTSPQPTGVVMSSAQRPDFGRRRLMTASTGPTGGAGTDLRRRVVAAARKCSPPPASPVDLSAAGQAPLVTILTRREPRPPEVRLTAVRREALVD